MKKIAACYIRVSTDDQVDLSPDSQLTEIRKYALQHDFYIPDEYIYKDEGISGRNTSKRPGFNKMITEAKRKPKPFDAVLLWKFSRFARNRTDAVVYKNLLRNQCGIEVISISENIGDDKGTSVILEAMFEAMDEYYSINLSTEVKRSMKLKAEKGQPLCPAPFGYINEDKGYVIEPEQAEIIRYIFNEYNQGQGFRTIATNLGKMGVKTKRGNIPDNRFVEYILRNPVYMGKMRWNPDGKEANKDRYRTNCESIILVDGTHEPIIPAELFEKVQTRLDEQKARYRPYQRRESKKEWMLRGLLRCSNCGATLVMASTKEPSVQCHNYARGQCHISHNISIRKANETVMQALETAAVTLDFQIVTLPTSDTVNESTVIKKMIDNEKKRLIKIRDAYELGVDSLEEYKERKSEINANIQKLQAELENTKPKLQFNKKEFAKKIETVLEYIRDPQHSDKSKNEMLRNIVSHIVFEKSTHRFLIFFHLR